MGADLSSWLRNGFYDGSDPGEPERCIECDHTLVYNKDDELHCENGDCTERRRG